MGVADSAALVASEVGGLKITPHPARKKRDRPMTSGVHCVATGPLLEGGQAGVASVLSVHTRDANGQRRTSGGDVVTVTLLPHDGAKVDAHVTDNTDGTYSCVVLPQKASPHCTLTVMVNGLRVEGSPFKTQILPGGTDTSCTEVYGRGLYDGMSGQRCEFTIAPAPAPAPAPALARTSALALARTLALTLTVTLTLTLTLTRCEFTIATKDSYGNRCSLPGDKFAVAVRPTQSLVKELDPYMKKYEVASDVTDNEDGTYTVGYQVSSHPRPHPHPQP